MRKLKKQLKELKKSASPSRKFSSALWTKLSDSYDEFYQPAPVRSPFFRFAAVGLTVMILFVTTGAGVYAYESPEVVEGHPLHFMKSGLENVEEQFARSPEQRVRFHTKMMERRIREAEHHQQNKQTLRLIAPKIADELGMTQMELREEVLNPETRDALLLELESNNSRYAKVLSGVIENEEEFRKNNAKPLQLPDELVDELESVRDRVRDQGLNPQERREILQKEIVPLLNEYRPKQGQRIHPNPERSPTGNY